MGLNNDCLCESQSPEAETLRERNKVFKFCENADGFKIYTDQLAFGEFNSYKASTQNGNHPCDYKYQNNAGVLAFECPITPMSDYIIGTGGMRLEEALQIASHTKHYAEYEYIARWMDEKALFDILKEDVTFRNSHASLIAFYNAMQSNAIAQIRLADVIMREVMEAYKINNKPYLAQLLANAENRNEEIDNTELQNENEQLINRVYFKILREGVDSLNDDDSTIVVELAKQCPYQAGSAVYKARTLNAIYNPAMIFDDIKLCNSVGVFKSSNGNNNTGLFDGENGYLQNLKPDTETSVLETDELIVYPNPASNQLNIRYNCKENSTLQLMNILGVLLKEIDLSKNVQRVTISINDLPTGVYTYRHIQNKTNLHTGKLIITN
jgi:Secretion system C-terminal sorting domain